ncbi:MAG TPA: DUF2130 domain-containing protein [Candidatus Dojkabacteria bacterium]|nr:DUF2130 domain-containing protein [Candidatus Dojkabacteria bacterium]HRP51334.1 DUF2130 domain-containing protein [Candidatus Dojkabacteria bacterium]
MATTIKCEQCGNVIEITDAIRKELEAKVLQETQAKHDAEIKALKEKQEQLEEQKQKEIEQVKQEISESAKKDAIEKVRKEYDTKINSTKEESEEREKQNQELQKQVSDLIKQLRESKDTEGKLKIQFEKQLLEEQDNIKQGAKKEAQEELSLQIAQKDKMLEDLKKQLQEAQRKAQQGSQQLQGEVQELALEDQLKQAFIYDEVSEVPKGINGADVIQTVRTNFGTSCGTIVWESKNTKAWSQQWVAKLKEDTRTLKADISVLVSSVLPEGIQSFAQIDGVWVCDMKSAIPLAFALRERIIAVRNIQEANKGKATKAEVVYNYLISNDFKQRIEVWIEYFKSRKEELDIEKRYFMKKWDKEDKNIMKVLHNTAGMYGDLQGLIGTALPKVQYLELPEEIHN